ncbi:MAG: hypothetical protein JST62_10980 [Bacteroidetes bacterium]|nr:hypothetical protein [Bacteroidota bacterium]
MKNFIAILFFLSTCFAESFGQVDSLVFPDIPEDFEINKISKKYFNEVEKKVNIYSIRLNNKTIKTLTRLSKWENKIKHLLDKTDPDLSNKLFSESKTSFNYMLEKVKAGENIVVKQKSVYDSYRDNLTTSFKYLEENKNKYKIIAQEEITSINSKISKINKKADEASALSDLIKSRKKELIDASAKLLLKSKYLKKINKDAWYYKEEIMNYRDIFSKPGKAEKAAKEVLKKIPSFNQFIRQNSMLASLFKSNEGTTNASSLTGLQTRTQINFLINSQIESAGAQGREVINKNIQSAQNELKALKDKLLKQTNGGSEEIPDFKPNMQKTKTFLQRLEYGISVQVGKTNNYLPSSTEFAFSIGYKLNDKSVIGLGASYKLGIGSIGKFRLTHEGIGFRSFIDWKIKNKYYASGGFEIAHNDGFKNVATLRDFNAWSTSGLIGITKKIPVKMKFAKNIKMQFLFDCLYKQNPIQNKPVLFRVGYCF